VLWRTVRAKYDAKEISVLSDAFLGDPGADSGARESRNGQKKESEGKSRTKRGVPGDNVSPE